MDISRTGIILNTERYEECVLFYKDLFNLNILFQKNDGEFKLTCFEFHGSYLMIETGGVSNPSGKSMEESSTKLRFNVPDIDVALSVVKAYGIDAKILKNSWGATININDPDGNRIGIRDEVLFADDIKG